MQNIYQKLAERNKPQENNEIGQGFSALAPAYYSATKTAKSHVAKMLMWRSYLTLRVTVGVMLLIRECSTGYN